ncbi:MAG: beta-glycosidase [Prevotellaceae bacterium]|jgi:glucosylceramidase|nr:beta-glycosidase [Prevotellaceae bacterium]
MKHTLFTLLIAAAITSCNKNTVAEWVATTPTAAWQTQSASEITFIENSSADVEIHTDSTLQTVDGFGACFNELGWTSLVLLSDVEREAVFKELFTAEGANFTICRMPVGANDFSRDWYSYNETDSDFEMRNFSVENDRETLIPFIKSAQKYNPALTIWASPWSPPTWMKENRFYACAPLSNFFDQRFVTDIQPEQVRREGDNMFITEDKYYAAYALYFRKFIEAYRTENIPVSMVMPQNEFNSCQPFPSCTWQAATLAEFTGKYLVPEMKTIGVEVMFGTMERPNPALVDTVLTSEGGDYISGVGFQWAGKEALPSIHNRYPNLKIYQTEQECGDGQNEWEGCAYSWGLMKHYFMHGANVYDYWNISLLEGGMSRWGWTQNSLVTVNENDKTFRYTYEYYLLKHFSHYVLPGAKMLQTAGNFDNLLAFRNKNGKIAVVIYNAEQTETTKTVKVGRRVFEVKLKPQSINTMIL